MAVLLGRRAGPGVRVTLPPAPDGVAECLRQSFPEIPDRALTKRDVVRGGISSAW